MLRVILFLFVCGASTALQSMTAEKSGAPGASAVPAAEAKGPAALHGEHKIADDFEKIPLLDSCLLGDKELFLLSKINRYLEAFSSDFQETYVLDATARNEEQNQMIATFTGFLAMFKSDCLQKNIDSRKIMAAKIPVYGTLVRKAIKLGYSCEFIHVLTDCGAPIFYACSGMSDFAYAWHCWENQDRENILKWLLESDVSKPDISDNGAKIIIVEKDITKDCLDENGLLLRAMIEQCLESTGATKKAKEKRYVRYLYDMAIKNFGKMSRWIAKEQAEVDALIQGVGGIDEIAARLAKSKV